MRNRYQLKRLTTQIRSELSTYSQEDLESLVDMRILFKDDARKVVRQSFHLRRSLARQMLGGDVANLGVRARSWRRGKELPEF